MSARLRTVGVLLAVVAALLVAAPAYGVGSPGPRIELDQTDPAQGDVVTFTVTQPKGSDQIRLVCGPDAAYYPPQQAELDVTQPVGSAFTLTVDGTCVAWLTKKDVPLVGTLFWVTP